MSTFYKLLTRLSKEFLSFMIRTCFLPDPEVLFEPDYLRLMAKKGGDEDNVGDDNDPSHVGDELHDLSTSSRLNCAWRL
jgi:hypothetical protein